MDFQLAVGTAEKHQVGFHYSRLTNTVRIDVDGDRVKKDTFWLWIPASRRYELKVGQAEPHDVVIEASFPRAGAKFANPICRVTIDGKLINEH